MPSGIGLADELAADDRLDNQAAPPVTNVPTAASGTTVTTGPGPGCHG